jgi:hypothetical protein
VRFARLITLTPDQFKAADVNGDGVVNGADATLILQYIDGIIHTFSAGVTYNDDAGWVWGAGQWGGTDNVFSAYTWQGASSFTWAQASSMEW